MHTNVYPKTHMQNTINVLEKASKHMIEIVVTSIALYTEVCYGEWDRERRIGQGRCCHVVGLELGNEELSCICSGLRLLSVHMKKNYLHVINIQPSQWLVKETSFASLDNHPSIFFFIKATAVALSIVQRKTHFISIYVQRVSCRIFWCLNL